MTAIAWDVVETSLPTIPVLADKYAKGWPEHEDGAKVPYVSLALALTTEYRTDAHFAAYCVPDVHRRLNTPEIFDRVAVPMTLFVVDIDGADHKCTDEWWSAQRPKIDRLLADHPGAFVYRTRGGYRLVYVLATPQILRSVADAEQWELRYAAWLTFLEDTYGIDGDGSCDGWSRLYRLPHTLRDGKMQRLETIGDPAAIGLWDVPVEIPPPPPPRQRTAYAPKGDEFDIRTLVAAEYPGTRSSGGGSRPEKHYIGGANCPWTAEHTSRNGRADTAILIFASGAYEFKCLHEHCRSRTSADFRKYHQPDWTPYDPSRPPQRSESEPIPSAEHPNAPAQHDESGDEARAILDEQTGGMSAEELPELGEPAGPADVTPAVAETDGVKGRHPNQPKLPEVRICTNMMQVCDEGLAALLANGNLYVRGKRLAHTIRDWSPPKWMHLDIPGGLPVIAGLAEATVRERMSAAARWRKWDARVKAADGSRGDYVPTVPPEWVAKTVCAREEWPGVPVLEGISESPILRLDGSVHDTPGYDEDTRWIFAPASDAWPKIKRDLTQDDARKAYAKLCEPFSDMLYVSKSDLAATVSLILSTVGRPAIRGPVPAHAVTASVAGAGKGLIVETCAIIATGREPAKMPVTHSDEELRKRLLPLAVAGVPIVLIDNIAGEFGSEAMDMILTSNTFRDRKLGVSEDSGDVPWRSVMTFTGNGVQWMGDIVRRLVEIRLDPKMEHPEDRTGFAYPDLKAHVAKHRADYYTAALTILAAYIRNGMPQSEPQKPAKGSFEAWDRLVRGSIRWASGGQDLDDGMIGLRKTGDRDLERLRALISELRRLAYVGALSEPTTAQILDYAKLSGSADLATAIEAYAVKGEPMNTKRLGTVLAKYGGIKTGRCVELTIDGQTRLYRIVRGDNAQGGVARWRIEEVTS